MVYFYECGICECLHPARFDGDCRNDANRFAAGELDEKFGSDGWTVISMAEADDWPAPPRPHQR